MDLRLNVSRLEGIVENVEKSVAEGDLDAAAMVLGSQTGKVGRFTTLGARFRRSCARRAPIPSAA